MDGGSEKGAGRGGAVTGNLPRRYNTNHSVRNVCHSCRIGKIMMWKVPYASFPPLRHRFSHDPRGR